MCAAIERCVFGEALPSLDCSLELVEVFSLPYSGSCAHFVFVSGRCGLGLFFFGLRMEVCLVASTK